MADITILNLNMLFVRYFDVVERERHLPLGPLYLTAALEREGFTVDFRDYQTHQVAEPFTGDAIVQFLADPAPVVGFSCMANLLPFTLLAMRDVKRAFPDRTLVLGGVGTTSIDDEILKRFAWVDVIVRGEAELSGPRLLRALKENLPLSEVPGITYREGAEVRRTERPPRIADLDAIAPPAYHHIVLESYTGFGVITSRGCPYPCTFCSVAPIWDHRSYHRSAGSVVAEIRALVERGGADMILFQDEFFVSGKPRVMRFCEALDKSGLKVMWKAFGRIDLMDEPMMRAMADTGCVEIRFGVESGSDRILTLTRKGFTADQTIDVVRTACNIFRRVDLFYVWGFPFETLEDFYRSVFQMIAFRAMGARILPSLLCLLPQTAIYRDYVALENLEFAPDLFPEYMITGHEISRYAHVEVRPEHRGVYDFIRANPDLFPGFFHVGLETNIRPKLRILQEHGFYPASDEQLAEIESCGAHSPNLPNLPNLPDAPPSLATRAV